MVVAQLEERSLLILDVRGSNPVISEIYIEHLLTCLPSNVLKDENKRKRGREWPTLKTYLIMK